MRLVPVIAACLALAAGPAGAGPTDQEYPLDVDLGDRVDPVRPGGEIVYELEVENFTEAVAPGVVVTDHLPPGTTYVVAHREPDWAAVPATVDGDEVRFDLGDVPPCDQEGTPRCRDLWVVLRIDPGVAEGTLLTNRVTVGSSDASLPPNEATTVTLAGSAALRLVKLKVGRPGRDRAQVHADLERNGLRTPLDPPTQTIDPSQGVSLRIGVPGEPPLFAVDVPPGEIECSDSSNPRRRVRCKLRDKRLWKPLGLKKLDVILPGYLAFQRNNAHLRLKLAGLDLPATTGLDFELVVEAAGATYTHTVSLSPNRSGRALEYRQGQGGP